MKNKKMNEDLFNEIASANKFEGYTKDGKELWSNPYIPDGVIYFLNTDNMIPKPKFNKKKPK